MLSIFRKFQNILNICINYLCSVFLVIMTLSIFYQVVARFFLDSPPSWTEELARYLMIWVVLLGVSPLLASSDHIIIDLISGKLSKSNEIIIETIKYVTIIVFSIIVFYLGIKLILVKKPQISPALQIPMSFMYFSVPVMAFLTCFNAFVNLLIYFENNFLLKKRSNDY